MIKNKTPLPMIRRTETDTDKFFSYLVNHVTRTPDVQPIATISPDQSAQRTWTTPQITILAILATLTLIALWCFGIAVLTGIFALFTVLYVALLALSTSWMIAVSRAQPETPFDETIITDLAKAPWPRYTVLCPLYHEKNIVPQFVQAMQALDYPQDCLQVLFLTEQDDRETRAAIRAMNLPANFEVLIVPQGTPKTKPRACNYGLTKASGEYCVIYDAEDVPDPLQLKKAVLTFASSDVNVACVQARLNFYNPSQNALTRFFTIEYSLWFDLILPGLQRLGFSLPLGGTSNHFRIAALKALGGWDSYNVTEDCDLGLKLARYGFKTIMLDSTTYEEANSRVFSWIKQRSRWIKGYMQTYLVHTRTPLKTVRQGKIKDLLSLHLFIGGGSIVLLINPIMWCMFAAYLIWRPVDLYHQLFPWPILYAGMLCFLVGNFLPIYVSMIACTKREQYSLVKWCLLLPLYWILASVAAFLAGYELITNPHKWRKTEHGLHLKHKASTQKIAAISMKHVVVAPVQSVTGNVTASVRAMSTVLMPAMVKERLRKSVKHDLWLYAVIALAIVCSVGATTYFFLNHEILLYDDAYSRMRIARSVFDSATPGLAQLGGVWLPLPHILMWPFIWNDFLWRSGLAGSFVGMICYVVTAAITFLTAKRLTGNNRASFVGTLVFTLNLNVLYVQSTPLSELVCIVTFALSMYFFLRWVQENKLCFLLIAAFCTFLATLARYDGWALFIALLVLVPLVDIVRKSSRSRIFAHATIFTLLAGMGIFLWLAWNGVIFGDPLYFQRGPYSSQAQTHQPELYHHLLADIRYETLLSFQTVGSILCVVAVVGFLLFLARYRLSERSVQTLIFFVPYVFYVAAYYIGQVGLKLPGANPPTDALNAFFNARFGTQIVPCIAIGVALFVDFAVQYSSNKNCRVAVTVFCALLIVFQYSSLAMSVGTITLRDGRMNYVCHSYPAANIYLADHYDGKMILEDTTSVTGSSSLLSAIQWSNIAIHNVIYQGSGVLWVQALHSPERYVNWIVVNTSDKDDVVLENLSIHTPSFMNNFQLVAKQSDGIEVFHRNGIPLKVTYPAPTIWNIPHDPCS